MSITNTGGQAFPHYPAAEYQPGMTLRDYFAAKAMQTLLRTANGAVGVNRYEHRVAETAYAVANAMLKARDA